MSKWPTAQAQRHLEALAKKHDIRIIWSDKPEKAYSWRRLVHIKHPATDSLYLGALHELGHVQSKAARHFEGRGKSYDDEVLMEAAAWAWGTRHCDAELFELIRPTAWKQTGVCWVSHLMNCRD